MSIKKREEKEYIILTEPCIPPLRHGKYMLEAGVKVKTGKEEKRSEKEKIIISIGEPLEVLETGNVDSFYPADGEMCTKKNILPHIVLKPATIPFEEDMVLLLFYEDESAVFSKEDKKSFVDISKTLFEKIVPNDAERELLVHGRKIMPELKSMALDTENTDELMAVVICNRVPEYGTVENPRRNRVCLAALRPEEKDTAVRLPVFKQWEFFAVEKENTEGLLEDVYTGSLIKNADGVSEEKIKNLFLNGYAPMQHFFREGSRSVSFFRGPFVPAQTEKRNYEAECSDALYRYDPETGIFDISYAAAWELGKLLVLENELVARKLLTSRNEMQRQIRLHRKNQMLMMAGVEKDAKSQILEFLENFYDCKDSGIEEV